MKKLVLLCVGIVLLSVNCNKKQIQQLTMEKNDLQKKLSALRAEVEKYRESDVRLKFLASKLSGIRARIETNQGDIELKFMPDLAPIHCFNFICRAESGFYDGTTFHRVIPGFMIQGGDPNSKDDNPNNDGSGGPLVNIPHEFNATNHKRGIVSMARIADVNAGAGCQFFIMHGDKSHLNNQYTAFGEVTKGMDVVDKIAAVKKDSRDRPLKDVTIKTIEVYRR